MRKRTPRIGLWVTVLLSVLLMAGSTALAKTDAPLAPQLGGSTMAAAQGSESLSCTLLVDCVNAVKADVVSERTILAKQIVEFQDGETVFDVLQRTLAVQGIALDYRGAGDSIYVSGINGLSEFDGGPFSGWMYNVDGWYPNYGCGVYYLEDGQDIEWRYTCDLGKDLGENWPDPDPVLVTSVGLPSSKTLMVGEADVLQVTVLPTGATDKSLTWTSSNSSVATVSANGRVTGVAAGTATITATAQDGSGKSGNCLVTVTAGGTPGTPGDPVDIPVAAVTLPQTKSVEIGQGITLDAVVTPVDATDKSLTWTSSNNAVATVNANGRVTGVAAGTATITATAQDGSGKSGSCLVTVTPGDTPGSGEDEAAVDAVIAAIAGIGTVTLDGESAIRSARAAYEGLTATQQAYVTNYSVLVAAEVRLMALKEVSAKDTRAAYEATGAYIAGKGVPVLGSVGGEWAVIGPARAGYAVPSSFYASYLTGITDAVASVGGILSTSKYTEYSRVILALTAIGADVTDVGGYDLLQKLADFEKVIQQGINGPIWALIALDCHGYEIPQVAGVRTQTTRSLLIAEILGAEVPGGGWNLLGPAARADVDMTAMAIMALAPYYSSDPAVKEAVDRALTFLSSNQNADGTFTGWEVESSESVAQVLVALTSLGIDPLEDKRFVKNGRTVLHGLMQFYAGEGRFKHVLGKGPDEMATEQAYYALAAYYRFLNGKTSLYDMTDVTISPSTPTGFVDVPTSHAYHAAIIGLAELGIVGGYPTPVGIEYRPGNPVLRAQVAKMLVIAFGFHDEEVTGADAPLFFDVPLSLGVPYPFDFVQEGAINGLIKGFTDGSFGPYENVTRVQLLRMLVRGAGDRLAAPPAGYELTFTDVADADRETVAIAKYNGVIDGRSDTVFDPAGSATRGHFAKMLYNVLSR